MDTDSHKLVLLDQLASMRASLFNLLLSIEFASEYLHDRLFNFKPKAFAKPVAPTREFRMHVLESKIEVTIKEKGDVIGWEDDEETVSDVALVAKMSLLRLVHYIMPQENAQQLYRLALEHGDFCIHNTSIVVNADVDPVVTSLYDWETASIVPALLSDPLVAASPVDLIINDSGEVSVTRIPEKPTATDLEAYAEWARHYFKVCAPRMAQEGA
jgi:hypothetical protein